MNNKYSAMRLKAKVQLLLLKWGHVAPVAATWSLSTSTIAGHLCVAFVTTTGEVRQEWV
jgi:hypothetical protein